MCSDMRKKIVSMFGAVLLLLLFLFIFGYACPFQRLTGIPCPGCNMMTSAYYLFVCHDLSVSLYYHALLIPTLCVLILCIVLTVFFKSKYINKMLVIWAVFMLGYYIMRMILYFPHAPMIYDTSSVFYRILH